MQTVRLYLIRLVVCAFVGAAAQALVSDQKLRKIVQLSAACLLAVTALQPLLQLDLSGIPDQIQSQISETPDALEEAKQKNDALLASLIRRQTEQAIREELERQEIAAEFTLTLQYDADLGAPIPWSILIETACEKAKKQSFGAFLQEELGIPQERQYWREP